MTDFHIAKLGVTLSNWQWVFGNTAEVSHRNENVHGSSPSRNALFVCSDSWVHMPVTIKCCKSQVSGWARIPPHKKRDSITSHENSVTSVKSPKLSKGFYHLWPQHHCVRMSLCLISSKCRHTGAVINWCSNCHLTFIKSSLSSKGLWFTSL